MTAAQRLPARLIIAAVLAAAALVPVFGGAYLTTFLFTLLSAYIIAQSWDWLHGEAGYVNLGHYIYFGIGAYAFALANVNGLPVVVSFVVAALFTGLMGAALSFPLFRLRGDYFAFATLALLPLFELLASNLVAITRGADGILLPPTTATIHGIDVKMYAYYVALAGSVAVFLLSVWMARTPFGYALKAIRNDEQAAEVVGIRIFPVKVQAMAYGAAAAAVAGGAYVWSFRYIEPRTVFGLDVALIPVAMALLGGSGLLWGPLIGAILLSVAIQLLIVKLTMLQFTIIGLAILLIGRYMPGGLLRARWIARIPLLAPLGHEHHERIAPAGAVGAGESGLLPLSPIAADRSRVLLATRDLTMAFGGNVAVNKVNLEVREGEILGLIGPNGSGKTTLFNCLSKVYEPAGGDIVFAGQSLRGLRRDTVSRLRIGRTYQIPRPFGDLTVLENVAMPLMFRDENRLDRAAALEEAAQFAVYAGLKDKLAERADRLSLQQRKAVEFARALACRPRLLLVDEVASGLTTAEVRRFVEHIREVRDAYGITVIWVEHIISALTQVADRLVVLEQGSVIADGAPDEVVRNEHVLRVYFGGAAHREPA
ncbi:MAG: branched-chain amino acid ABC transporter ATP-binding protein/permease [Xanthobacteraceae bacterium]|nr:branched-chain amino acid ABC transporter ATP-binding protein/permease [Xanthobacteraceae bacterium]